MSEALLDRWLADADHRDADLVDVLARDHLPQLGVRGEDRAQLVDGQAQDLTGTDHHGRPFHTAAGCLSTGDNAVAG